MTSALWLAASGWPAARLLEAVPPACRRHVDAPYDVRIEGQEALVQTPTWSVAGASHFVPSFAAHTTTPFGARLELSVRVAGTWSGWAAGVSLGTASFAPLPPAGSLDVDVDVFRARGPVDAARLRLRLHSLDPHAVLVAPWMLALSASPVAAPARPKPHPPEARTVRLAVPGRSQMEAEVAIAPRICSPTCVAMLLDFWRRPASLDELAAEIFHPGVDLYGVWPSAVLAAGRRGLAGYLLRFPDWAAARWCLARGLPVIASIRYDAGELAGAAVTATPGHLIVLTGWDGDDVLVNDPAAPTATSVGRRYRLAELARVWLERSGVGYVLFAPDAIKGG
jgi:hypothetical protein